MFAIAAVDSDGLNTIVPPGEHELLVFFVQILVLLVAARGLGQLMRAFGQPSVIGELGAGLILGPSVFGKVAPGAFDWLFPVDPVQSAMLFTVGWLGVVLLLVITGFETDLALIRALGRATSYVATGSLVVPFAFGIAVGFFMPALFLGAEDDRIIFALFMGTALSISSLPVIAKVLTELGLMRRNFGQVTLAAGMANDIVGWIALGVIAGIAQSGAFSMSELGITLGGMAAFLLVSLTIGQWMVDQVLRVMRRVGSGITGSLTALVGIALVAGVATQAIGVEAVLGAFVAGIVIGRSRFRQPEVEHHLESATLGVFAPIFFATAGLRVDLGLLGDGEVLAWAVAVLVVASVSKFLGSLIGGRYAGLPTRESAALGVGLNARGALEIVIATVGLSVGVLNGPSYAVIVVMAMVTSMMAPPMLRAIARSWPGTEEEQERLEREELLDRNVFVRPERALLPSRGNPGSLAAARLLDLAWPREAGITLLSAGDSGDDTVEGVSAIFAEHDVEVQRARRKDAAEALRDQAGLGYGVLVLGAESAGAGDLLVSPLVDEMLQHSPIPVMLVRLGSRARVRSSGQYRRILVPVTGTRVSRGAQELAVSLAGRLRVEVINLHVVAPGGERESGAEEAPHWIFGSLPAAVRTRSAMAERILAESASYADELHVPSRKVVREGTDPGQEIMKVAGEFDCDLIVMGADLRSAEGRPFLGHNAERVLQDAAATVVILTFPPSEGNGG